MTLAISIALGLTATLLTLAASEPANSGDLKASGHAAALWYAHVEPLLSQRCFKCHGGVKQKGGLDLRDPSTILHGGDSGAAVDRANPKSSLLLQVIQPGADPQMPPGEDQRLTPEEILILQRWVERLTGEPKPNDRWNGESSAIRSEDLWTPPDGTPPTAAIDLFLERLWTEHSIPVPNVAPPAEFARRVHLDLIGRVPSQSEMQSYVSAQPGASRSELVDQLLESDEFSRHFAEVFDVVLMERKGDRAQRRRESNKWNDYLEWCFRENRPWNLVVREIIEARPDQPEEHGSFWFLYERRDNFQLMAEAIAPVAFGARFDCAQCHNHPLAYEIKQAHYWGLVAALNRSKNIDTEKGPAVAESAIGGFVSFTNLEKESQPALMTFLHGKTIDETWPEDVEKEEDSPGKYLIPPPPEKEKAKEAYVPAFSRRAELAQILTEENPYLARSFVNRIWAMLMGRGLVHPVDQMNSRHPASHPALLHWLSEDFASHGYDIKRLIRQITLSRGYQLDSRPAADPGVARQWFAAGLEKPLSAEAYYRSLLATTGHWPLSEQASNELKAEELKDLFVEHFPIIFHVDYNASLQQAMFLSNNPLIDKLLEPAPGTLTARLLEIGDAVARINEAFSAVLFRTPSAGELEKSVEFLRDRADDPTGAIQQLCWALMTSSEYQLNH